MLAFSKKRARERRRERARERSEGFGGWPDPGPVREVMRENAMLRRANAELRGRLSAYEAERGCPL